jgi:integrase
MELDRGTDKEGCLMAGHVQDRWFKTERTTDGTAKKIKTSRYGVGFRYRARYVSPDGTEKSRSFPDRQKRQAELWLARVEADMSQGIYIDPRIANTTFREYAERWLATQTTDLNTRNSVTTQIRKHAIPHLGMRPLGSFKPSHIREWLGTLETTLHMSSYRRVIFASVSSIFTAAVDDGLIPKNPCSARTVKSPKKSTSRVVPWLPDRVFAVRAALPPQYRTMVDIGAGCGLRQGEIFGLAVNAVNFSTGWLNITCQVKLISGHLVFAPPKREKERDVPLPDSVASMIRRHLNSSPPTKVTLPWQRPDGDPTTRELLFTRTKGTAIRSSDFNVFAWKPALATAGVIPSPVPGERHQAAREHGMHALRHFYASVLLDAGENIKALSHYLGHSDPGFTLRVYTHLMPSSDGRARTALDRVYEATITTQDGPQTAQNH